MIELHDSRNCLGQYLILNELDSNNENDKNDKIILQHINCLICLKNHCEFLVYEIYLKTKLKGTKKLIKRRSEKLIKIQERIKELENETLNKNSK